MAICKTAEGVPKKGIMPQSCAPTNEFEVPPVGKAVAKFFAQEKAAGRKYKVETRKPAELSVRIALA